MRKNEIFAVLNILKTRILNRRIPIVVGWSLTNRCNWACAYCGRKKINSDELTSKQVFSIIDELSVLGTYCINFTGGESLLRDDISKLIDYAKNKGIRIELTSNGSLVPSKINEIRNIDNLILSYDGPAEVQDKQRDNGSHQEVENAIRVGKNNNIPVRLQTVITKYNLECLNSILNFADRFGVVVNFTPVRFIPYAEEEDIESFYPPADRYRIVMSEILNKKTKGNKFIGNSISGLKYLRRLLDGNNKRINCCGGKIYCRIETNGDLYPCGDLIFKTKPINCIKYGFKNAFSMMNLKQIKYCGSCWCNNRLELNYLYSFNWEVILNMKRIHRL